MTVSLGKIIRPCGTSAMPERMRAWAGCLTTSTPSKVMTPVEGFSRPTMLRMSVVLPTPLRPMRHTTWPLGTSNETPWSTCTDPYANLMSLMLNMSSTQISLDYLGVGLEFL